MGLFGSMMYRKGLFLHKTPWVLRLETMSGSLSFGNIGRGLTARLSLQFYSCFTVTTVQHPKITRQRLETRVAEITIGVVMMVVINLSFISVLSLLRLFHQAQSQQMERRGFPVPVLQCYVSSMGTWHLPKPGNSRMSAWERYAEQSQQYVKKIYFLSALQGDCGRDVLINGTHNCLSLCQFGQTQRSDKVTIAAYCFC